MNFFLEHLASNKNPDKATKPEFKKYSDILPSSQFESKKGDYWEDVSPTTKWRNLPETLGGGQYARDPERSQSLVKSMRQFTPDLNTEMRRGLSSRFFQVDHIIPLWAGGSDNPENKQTLTIGLHDKKTKVGAVARTLYYNKEIDLSKARSMLMNWKNKDVEGIEINDKGELAEDSNEALVIAQHKKHEWDNPKAIKVSVSDVIEEMKRGWAGQLVGGAVSGFTGHWADPYKFEDEKKTTGEKVSRFVGELGGMLVGLKGMGLILGGAIKATGLARILPKSRLLIGSDAAIKAGKIRVSRQTGMKVIQNAGLFITHGQLSKQESDEAGTRIKRFLSDAAFGSLVSIPGNSLKSYAGLAGGVYTLSALEGATPKESLFNSALMVGFHGLGHKSRNRAVDDFALKESLKFRAKFLGDDVIKQVEKDIESGAYRRVYTSEELNKQNKTIAENLRKEVIASESYTPEMLKAEIDKVIISGRQLYKGGLGVEKKLAEDIIDTRTIIRRENVIKRHENAGISEPIYKTITKDSEKILTFSEKKLSPTQKEFIKESNSDIVSGRVRVVGTAKEMSGKNIEMAYEKGLRAKDKVVLFSRPDMKEFIEVLNKGRSSIRKTPHPENNIQVLALIDKDVFSLGMLPSFQKISTRPFNINEALRKFGMKEFDPKINKDTIAEAMKKTKTDYIVGEIEYITKKAKHSEQPSITIKITPESYAASKGLTKAEAAKAAKELKAKRASDRIIESKLPIEGRTYFTPMIRDLENALLEKTPELVKKYFKKELGIKLTDNEVKNLFKKKEITTEEIFDIMKKMKDNGRMNKRGKSFYDLLLGEQGYYGKLGKKERDFVNSLKLLGTKEMPKTEVIKKEIKIAEKPIAKEEIDKRVIEEVPIKKEKDDIGSLEKGEVKPDEVKRVVSEEELVISKKKDSFEDWMNFEGGVLKGGGKVYNEVIQELRNKELKLRERGMNKEVNVLDKRADSLANDRNLLNRENLTKHAKVLYNESGKNFSKSFENFKERFGKKLKELTNKNPFEDFKNSQALKHEYHRFLEIAPVKRAYVENGKLQVSSEKGQYKPFKEVDCFAGVEVKKQYKDNSVELIRTDIGNTKFSKVAEKDPIKQKEEIIKAFEKDGYCTFGISKNALKDIVAIPMNKRYISKFDKNPSEYLLPEEKLADYAKGKNEKTKVSRVYAQDVLGYPKTVSADVISKRLPLTHNYELPLPWKGNIGVDIFKSPKVLDGKFSIFDGATIFTESLGKKVGLNGGFISDRSCYKMTTAHRVEGYNNNKGNLILMKHEVFVIRDNDKVYKPYFDKMVEEKYGKGKKFEGDRAISFDDNVKVGKEIFEKSNNFLEFPAEAFRFEYNKPHNSAASTSISMLGQFSYKDGVNKEVKNLYKPPVEKYAKAIDDLNNGKNIKEVLKKYEIDIDKSLYDDLLLGVNNGEGVFLANKSLHDIVNQIFNKQILHGSFIKGDHLTIMPDIGILPGGKFLSRGQVIVSRETYKALGEKKIQQMLMERFPITNLTAGSKNKILIAEDLGITSLKKDCIIVSHESVHKDMQGDFDGDSVHLTSIGKKPNQIPEELANAIEKRRIKEENEGGFKFEEQISHEKKSHTYENTLKHMDHVIHGTTGINHVSATKRIMESLVDSGFRAKQRVDNSGKIIIDIFVGTSKKRFSYYNTNQKAPKDFVPKEIKIEYGKDKQEAVANLLQASVDSPTKKNLSIKMGDKGYDKNYIWKEILGTSESDFIKAISSRVKGFQKFFQLDSKKRDDLKNNEDIFKRIEEGNVLTDLILASGGKIGPVQELFSLFKGARPLKNYYSNTPENRKIQFNYDRAGRETVIRANASRFDISKNEFGYYKNNEFIPGKTAFILDKEINKNINRAKVYKIVSEVKKMSEKHSRDYANRHTNKEFPRITDSSGKPFTYEEIRIIKKDLKNSILEYWDKVKLKLNQDEKDAVAYYLTTAYDAVINSPNRFLKKNIDSKEMLIFRLRKIYNEASPAIAKTYNHSAEYANRVKVLQKYLKGKNVKIEEKAAEKLIENPVKGKEWLVDILKKYQPKKESKGADIIYALGRSPMTYKKSEIQFKGGFENIGKGTPAGDGKDKAMRKVADGFIGEIAKQNSSSATSKKVIENKKITTPKVIMLARNYEFRNKELKDNTKNQILKANQNGAEFVVGDMPNVDSQFIKYLKEIGAKFTIYHTGKQSRIID